MGALGLIASGYTAVVCPALQVDTQAVCTHYDLGGALADVSYDTFVLTAGTHLANVTITRPVTIQADPGATVTNGIGGLPVFTVLQSGSGTVLSDIELDPIGLLDGPLVFVDAASVTVERPVVRNTLGLTLSVLKVEYGGALTVVDPDFENVGFQGFLGYAPISALYGASVTVEGGTFRETGGFYAGAVYVDRSEALVRDVLYEPGQDGATSFVYATMSDVQLIDATVGASTKGGVTVYAATGGLTLSGGTFAASPDLSAHVVADASIIDVDGTRFEVQPGTTGLRANLAPSVVVTGATFVADPSGPGTLAGPLLDLADAGAVTISDTWFCDGLASSGGAVKLASSCLSGACVFDRAVFQRSRAQFGGGAIYASASPVIVTQSTFVANSSDPYGFGAAVESAYQSPVDIRQSLFVANVGVATVAARPADVIDFAQNAFDGNSSPPASFPYDDTANPTVAVVFERGPGRCGDSVTVDGDASDPFLHEHQVGAEPVCLTEVPGDGLDQDCDGYDACPDGALVTPGEPCPSVDPRDADGDGILVDVDCNDQDADVGVCRLVGGGCDSSGGQPAWALAALAALAVRRRR